MEQGWGKGKMLEKGRRASRVRQRKMLGAGLEEGKMLEKGRRASRVRQRKMLGAGLEEGSIAGKRGGQQAN